ncbi:MAG: MipA/OmpV family protein [Pseudomonadota bacterium]
MINFNAVKHGFAGLFAVLGFAAVAGESHAEGGWIVTIGGRATARPPYEGADHDVIRPAAIFNLRRADKPFRFTPPDGGSSVGLFTSRYIVAGPLVRFQYSRPNTGAFTGFDKIGFAAEPGAFVDLWPVNWLRGRVEVRRGVAGHSGFVGDAGLDLVYTGHRWDFSVGPRFGYGDSRYLDTYFGVTPQEALRSPIITTPYEPGAGTRYYGAEVAGAYHLTSRWWTIVDVGYHRLSHLAADSPVIQVAGSRDQVAGSVGLSYMFGVRGGNVEANEQATW